MLEKIRNKMFMAGKLAAGKLNRGWCPICEKRTWFVTNGPWLRDEYLCRRCSSIPRWRALVHALETYFPDWRSKQIHESSPGSPSSSKLAQECKGYSSSQFFPDVDRGNFKNGVRCENLQALTFADNSFDLFVTQDVFEHVPDPSHGFREVARVLKRGGAHVFTVPYYAGRATLERARLGPDGQMLYRAPKDFHRNPVDPEGSLVTTEWGDDVADFIFRESGLTTTIYHYRDRAMGLDGDFLYVFVSRKT